VDIWRHTFSTSARDGGEWSVSHPRSFTPKERVPGTHAAWASEPVWTRWWGEKSQPLPGLNPPIIQIVAKLFTAELFRLLHDVKVVAYYELRRVWNERPWPILAFIPNILLSQNWDSNNKQKYGPLNFHTTACGRTTSVFDIRWWSCINKEEVP